MMEKQFPDKKSVKEKPSDARFTVDLHIRLTEEERRVVQAKADELGCNLSQAARTILFKKAGSAERCSDTEAGQRRLLALRGTRAEFKKIAASYCAFIDSYRRSVELTDRNGNPVVSTELTQRLLSSLEGLTLKLQASLNEALRSEGQNEEHSISRMRPVAAPQPAAGISSPEEGKDADIVVQTDSKELDIKYCNMERIMIIGKLADNASKYKTPKGEEKVRFKVNCESTGRNGSKIVRTYSVYWRDTDIAERLTKDVGVFVEGTFATDDNKEPLLFADIVKFASE